MIKVDVRVREDGCLAGFRAEGHASRIGEGFSPACAAATILLRTAGELFAGEKELKVDIQAPEEGIMTVEVGPVPVEMKSRMRGVSDFFTYGLIRLSRESPEDVQAHLFSI